MNQKPPSRKLRGYAFDPSLSLQLDTAIINNIVYKIFWEEKLDKGPCGEYVEVIDYDPTVKKYYTPVNLNDRNILAQDGLTPSESNPLFHQQMVYAVTMTTIKNFENALGRPIIWSPHHIYDGGTKKIHEEYVKALRIYPHAMRDANAFYSPQKKALLFGYFSSQPAEITLQMPNSLIFTCLSHDIIAHETTHAILDGLYRKYTEDTNPDILAFHEAFADIVALFQHFTFPDVLKSQIAKTRGNLASQNLLGQLAQEFGTAIGGYGALRDAIGSYDPKDKKWKPKEPNGDEYRTTMEPHARGAILVAAIFDAFLTIYKNRIADLLRIASDGTGILQEGELHPDLVNRLAAEASKTASHVLKMCIRALDFCPPVDLNFGDYLRAIITADVDAIEDDDRDYRIAFIDAFRKRGIYPTGVKNLSVESLCYPKPNVTNLTEIFARLKEFLKEFRNDIVYIKDRKKIFDTTREYIAGNSDGTKGLHKRIDSGFDNSKEFEQLTGMMFNPAWEGLGIATSEAYGTRQPSFEVHSLHFASRVGPTGSKSNQIIISLLQRANISVKKDDNGEWHAQTADPDNSFRMVGGCTLIFDIESELELQYAISKPLLDVDFLKDKGGYRINQARAVQMYAHQNNFSEKENVYQAYFGSLPRNSVNEPFAFLHNH